MTIEAYSADGMRGLDAAIVAVPADATIAIVARLRELGVPTIDTSTTSRATAPLYFDQSPHPPNLTGVPVVALPSPEALAFARILMALEPFSPSGARATILKAASAAGEIGIKDLAESTGRLLNGQEPETPIHGHRLAFNVVPQVGPFTGAETASELEFARDVGRLLGRELPVDVTLGSGGWFYGDFISAGVSFEAKVQIDAVRKALSGRALMKLLDDPGSTVYPMPALVTGDDALHIGRLRADPTDARSVQFVGAIDGARATAALAISALAAVLRARRAH